MNTRSQEDVCRLFGFVYTFMVFLAGCLYTFNSVYFYLPFRTLAHIKIVFITVCFDLFYLCNILAVFVSVLIGYYLFSI